MASDLPTWMTIQLDPDGTDGRLGVRLSVGLVSVGLVVIAAATLLTGGSSAWAVAAALLGVAIATGWAVITRPRWLLASHLLLRLWLIVAAAALFTRRRPGEEPVAWLAASLLVVVLTGEPVLRRVLGVSRVVVEHLPGVPPVRELVVPVRAVPLSVLACSLIGGLLAAVRAPAWIWLGIVVLTAGLASLVTLSAGRRLLADRRRHAKIRSAVRSYAPEFAIYTARPDDASYQVSMWLPYLARSGRKFVIITRNGAPAQALAELTDAPVICCPSIADVEAMLVPSLTTVFYVNASSGNGQMVRHSHLAHVYLGHGDSDKAPSYNPTHAMYDVIFAAGQAAIDRYPAHQVYIPRERFAVVGRPQVEGIERPEPALAAAERAAARTVLYAPTWVGHVDETALYSLPSGADIVAALLGRGARVIFRPHPFSYASPDDRARIEQIQRLLAADQAVTGREHVWGDPAEKDWSVIDCFNASDVLVSDVSSVVSDYLFSGKPIAIYVVGADPEQFARDFPVARAGYLMANDLANLEPVLDDLLGADPARAQRLALREYYLGDFPARSYADAFVNQVDRVVSGLDVTRADRLEDLAEDEDGEDEAGGVAEDEVPRVVTGGGKVVSARSKLILSGSYALLDGSSAITAAASTVIAVSGWSRVASVICAALTVGWICLARPPWSARSKTTLLGGFAVQRVLLFVTAAVLLMRQDPGHRALVGVLLVLLAVTPVLEMWAREILEVRRLRVVNLPTLDYSPIAAGLHSYVYAAAVVVVVVELALAVAGAAVAMLIVAAVSAALVGVLLPLDIRLLGSSERASAGLHDALEAYAPQFAIYFAATPEAAYQLEMWMPFFERIGRRFLVITRSADTVPMIQGITEAPVLLCRTLRSLDDTLVSSMTAVFYVNNGLKNTHFIERRDLTHVWLNHGDSEKPACFNPVHAIYDRIFTAGQAGIDRYARHGIAIAPEKFQIVGRPQVATIDVVPARAGHSLHDRYAADDTSPVTVLYAPTWVGPFADSNVYSLPVGAQIVQALVDRGARVVFRAHPLNYGFLDAQMYLREIWKLLEADAKVSGRRHVWGEAAEQEMSLEDCFNASDAMIADVSAVVSDYLYSEKPFAIVAMGGSSERLVAEAPVASGAYVIQSDLDNIGDVLDEMLGADPLRPRRRETKTYYLGDAVAADYVEGFLSAARRLIDRSERASVPGT